MRRMARFGISVVAGVTGWVAGTLYFLLTAWFVWGDFRDVGVTIVWTIPFALMGWLIFFLPVTLLCRSQSALFDFPLFAIVAGVLGMVAFFALVGWWAPLWSQSYAYLIHPSVAGLMAGTVYSLATRNSRHGQRAG